MDSNDQAVEQSTQNNQEVDEVISKDSTEQTIEINWEKLSIEEVKKGYLRQSDYTKKTQELAQKRKELWIEEASENDPATVKMLKQEIEQLKKQQQEETEFSWLLEANPSLKQSKSAIQKYAKNTWVSYEEAVIELWLTSKDKIRKAKSRDIPWGNAAEYDDWPTSFNEMNDEQFKQWMKENWATV